jgi:hypothetical protein
MNTKHFTTSRLVLAVLVALALTGTLLAQSQNSSPKLPNKYYMLMIDGTATMVGKWACGGDAKIEAKPASSAPVVPGLPSGVATVAVTASVPGIECGDNTMNKHLRKALKMDEYPEIRYLANKYTLVDNGTAVQTSGELTIAGVTKPIGLGAKLVAMPEGGTKVTGTVEINMADFGVKPPSLFFGALKVANVVSVKFDTVVRLPHEVTEALFPKQ